MNLVWIIAFTLVESIKVVSTKDVIVTYPDITAPGWPVFLSLEGHVKVVQWSFEVQSLAPTSTLVKRSQTHPAPLDQPDDLPYDEITINQTLSNIRRVKLSQNFKPVAILQVKVTTRDCVESDGYPKSKCTGKVIAKSFDKAGSYVATAQYQLMSGISGSVKVPITVQNIPEPTGTRQEFRKLTAKQWQYYVESLQKLKDAGVYDLMVAVHQGAMQQVYNEAYPDMNYAHGGPAFLPWHRLYLRIMEKALQDFGQHPTLMLPTWNWTIDSALPGGPKSSPLWTEKYVGGKLDKNGLILDGPFCSQKSKVCAGKWKLRNDLEGPYLKRQLGQNVAILPRMSMIKQYMSTNIYDEPPYSDQSNGIRAYLEGWQTIAHNVVHQFVGGTMVTFASPNDPVFLMHHAFLESLYQQWQATHKCYGACYPLKGALSKLDDAPHAILVKGQYRIPGQHYSDNLWPWNVKVSQMVEAPLIQYQ